MYKNITGDLLQIVKGNTWQDLVTQFFLRGDKDDGSRMSLLMGAVVLWDELCRQSVDVLG